MSKQIHINRTGKCTVNVSHYTPVFECNSGTKKQRILMSGYVFPISCLATEQKRFFVLSATSMLWYFVKRTKTVPHNKKHKRLVNKVIARIKNA